jgi:hypothetical protein
MEDQGAFSMSITPFVCRQATGQTDDEAKRTGFQADLDYER